MTQARVAYGDLLVPLTLSATTNPPSTLATNIITNLYREAYRSVYGAGHYSAYSALAEDPIIDTADCYQIILTRSSEIVSTIIEYTTNRTDTRPKYPKLGLTQEDKDDLGKIKLATTQIRHASREDEDIDEVGDGT